MKIQRATFMGVSGVPDLSVDLTEATTGAPRSLVVVSGPGASGKTRMIEALMAAKEAIRAYGPMTPGAPWIRSGGAAKIRIAFHIGEEERAFAGTDARTLEAEVVFRPDRTHAEADDGLRAVLGRYSHNGAHGKLDYVPAERRIPTFPPFAGLGTGEQRIVRLAKDPRKYGFVLPFLRSLDHDAPRRERFAQSLAALSPTCRYEPDPTGDAMVRCFQSRGGSAVTAAQLSHAEADAVLLAATAALVGLDHSIVFIDRPDLHVEALEPLLLGLEALGEDNQLWLTGGARLSAAARRAHHVSLDG